MTRIVAVDAFFSAALTSRIYTVPAPYEMSRANPEIIGENVSILFQGTIHTGLVHAVERYCLSDTIPIRKGEPIGLVIYEEGIWLQWKGGENPAPHRKVMIRRCDNMTQRHFSDRFDWSRTESPEIPYSDIVEWMLLPLTITGRHPPDPPQPWELPR